MRRSVDPEDVVQKLVDGLTRFLFITGGVVALICAAFLFFYYNKFSQPVQDVPLEQAKGYVAMFGQGFLVSALISSIAACVMFWTEEVLGVVTALVGGALFLSPLYLPSMMGGAGAETSEISAAAMKGIQNGGLGIGLIGIFAIVFDVASRMRDRVKYGSRSDAMQYGKGIKQEDAHQLVFLGKCWQMSYCRKFIREQCPIYHSRRTCWKERVGCMCEEKVIANAMSGVTIPRDAVAAAKFIPYNSRVTPQQKAERCRQCVIYNERQRQKYKIVIPAVVVTMVGLYVLLREPLKVFVGNVALKADAIVGQASLTGKSAGAIDRLNETGFQVMTESLAACLMLMLMAYALKAAEYAVFKLKL